MFAFVCNFPVYKPGLGAYHMFMERTNKELTMTSTNPIHTHPIGCAHWYSKVSKCSGPVVTGTDRCREHLSDLGIRVLTAEQVARTAEQAQTIIQEAGPEHLLSVIHDAQEGEDMRSEFDEAEAEKISVMWAVFTAAQGRK